MIKKVLTLVFLILIALFFIKNPGIAKSFFDFSKDTVDSGINVITGNTISNLTENNMTGSNITSNLNTANTKDKSNESFSIDISNEKNKSSV